MATAEEQMKLLVQKPVKIVKFRGRKLIDNTVDTWITQQVAKLKMCGYTFDSVHAKYLLLFGLTEQAAEWLNPYVSMPETDWKEEDHPGKKVENLKRVLQELTGQFVDKAIIAQQQIAKLKQRGRPVQTYIQEFLGIKSNLKADIVKNDVLMAQYFYLGLDRHIAMAYAVEAKVKAWTLANWIERVRATDDFKNAINSRETQHIPRSNGSTDKIRWGIPMDVDKVKYDNWKDNNNAKRKTFKKKKNECFKCGKPGHWAKNCTSNNNDLQVDKVKYKKGSNNHKYKKKTYKGKPKGNQKRNKPPFGRKMAKIETETEGELDF